MTLPENWSIDCAISNPVCERGSGGVASTMYQTYGMTPALEEVNLVKSQLNELTPK